MKRETCYQEKRTPTPFEYPPFIASVRQSSKVAYSLLILHRSLLFLSMCSTNALTLPYSEQKLTERAKAALYLEGTGDRALSVVGWI